MSSNLKRTFELVNAISPSFCAAKWYNASIWLSNGRTASCHHPLAHYIPTKELLKDASALHNTQFKKEQRRKMLAGERPEECGYCWRVEDLGQEGIFSDRVYKSMIYNPADVLKLMDSDPDQNVDPKTLEICFDNLCNMGCSYCNSEFSSTWSTDIAENGPYSSMMTSGGNTYENDGQHGMPFGPKNEGNFYITKFFEWYKRSLRENLEELRVSGGEPSRSPDFWKLVETFNNERFRFAVNSNLMMDKERLNRLIAIGEQFKEYEIYTSGESYGKHAHWVRSGIDYKIWRDNLYDVAVRAPKIGTHIMMTISAFSIWTVDQFLDDIVKLRHETNIALGENRRDRFHMSVNILRFPSFQSVNMIDTENKHMLAERIEAALARADLITDNERNNFQRCIAYLRNVDRGYEDQDSYENKVNDLKKFVQQYSARRNMPSNEYMPPEFNNWISKL
jgi:hypothetical protein